MSRSDADPALNGTWGPAIRVAIFYLVYRQRGACTRHVAGLAQSQAPAHCAQPAAVKKPDASGPQCSLPTNIRWCACAHTHTQSSYSPYFKNWGDLTHIRYRIESHVATGRCGESLGQSWRLRLALTSIPGSDMIFLRLWLWERAETARHETTQCSSSCKPQSGSLCVCMHARMAMVTTEAAGPRCPFSQHLRARYAISIFRSFTNQAS